MRVLAYLRDNTFDPELTVGSVLSSCGVRDRSFSTYFRAVTGIGPRELIERERIRKARELLLRTDQPVWTIAFDIGFASPASFCRAFKRAVGVSPFAWRRSVRLLRQEK
jgi:AraC family transcriptional regulator